MAEMKLDEEAPAIEAATCAACEDVTKVFNKVKVEIEAVVGKLGNAGIEKAVDGVLNGIDNALESACPSKPSMELEAPTEDCLAEEDVAKILDGAQDALTWAETELTQAVNKPLVGNLAEMALTVVKTASKDLADETPKIEAMACAACNMVANEIEVVKGKILSFLKMMDDTRITTWAEKVL